MTAQASDAIRIGGRELALYSLPLDNWFALAGTAPPFSGRSSDLWRGYIATWEVTGDRLYLVEVNGSLPDGRESTLGDLFPGFPERVFAHWYSGTLRIPQGEEMTYFHGGFGYIHESMLCIDVREGVVVGRSLRPMDGGDL
jgi:hypothetical protein